MNINFDYLDRVRRIAALYTKRMTSELVDGDFRSKRHGRSLEFDDLREYHFGDDVNMIDWKSSSRAGKTLIRRYFAERRHDVVFVGDTGRKMTGDTPAGESKEQIALMAFGIAAYILDRQGVNFAMSCSGHDGYWMSVFSSGTGHLERLLYGYKDAIESGDPDRSFPETLLKTASSSVRHRVMVIITDGEGLAAMDHSLVSRLVYYNDVYIFKIEDAYLTEDDAFDLDADKFADPFLSICRDLHREELRMREQIERTAEETLTPNRVFFKSISKEEEIVETLIWLFGRRKGII